MIHPKIMDKNFSWFIKADLRAYKGKFIAIAKGRVVCSGQKAGDVYQKAKTKFPKTEVILWRVPEGEAFAFRIRV